VGRELERLGLSPSKARGQSFLRDEGVAERQVMAAGVAPGDEVLEVGGGLGVLTRALSRRGAKVRVLEIEGALARHLRSLGLPGVAVEEADALKADLGRPRRVVSNIPYSVSSELIERLSSCGALVVVLLVQSEVGKRLAAGPGSKAWARLPAIVQREYTVEILETVPPNAFFPQPRVRSALVRMRRRPGAGEALRADFAAVVGALFALRRKKVRNSVARAAAALRAPPERALAVVEAQGIADRRPEELAVGDFEALAKALANLRMTK